MIWLKCLIAVKYDFLICIVTLQRISGLHVFMLQIESTKYFATNYEPRHVSSFWYIYTDNSELKLIKYLKPNIWKNLFITQILCIRFANDNHFYWTHVLDFSSHGNTQANKNNLYWSNKVNNNMRCKVEKSRKGSLLSV